MRRIATFLTLTLAACGGPDATLTDTTSSAIDHNGCWYEITDVLCAVMMNPPCPDCGPACAPGGVTGICTVIGPGIFYDNRIGPRPSRSDLWTACRVIAEDQGCTHCGNNPGDPPELENDDD